MVMRIAIPITEGRLCPHFGHCEEFALVDVDEFNKQIIRRHTITAPPHQPGMLPRWLREHGADLIIAGGMGMRAQQLFNSKDIQVIVGAPAEEPEALVSDLLQGKLSSGRNICDH